MTRYLHLSGFIALGLLGCAPAEGGGSEGTPSPVEPVCVAPAGMAEPRSIAQAVALLNVLPKPVTLPCFIETLPRPLSLHATKSVFSAQPAVGTRSPRIFLFLDPLILSVVPEGDGSELLEFGELRSETRSVKAEIAFPVLAPLAPEAPFDRVLFAEGVTSCGFCHRAEEPDELAGVGGFVSQALRPAPQQRVGVDQLLAELSSCDAAAEPERCAMIEAVFGHGAVVDRDFPAAMDTFF